MSSGESPFDIAYFYENNNALTNSDSQLRNVSLSITSNTANTTVLFIDLVFTNTDIDWILLSEVEIFSGMFLESMLNLVLSHSFLQVHPLMSTQRKSHFRMVS